MKKEFTYAPQKGLMAYLSIVFLASIVIIVAFLYPFDIKIFNIATLRIPYSQWLLMGIGVILIIFQFRRISLAKIHRRHARPIVVNDDTISFVQYEKKEIREQAFHLSQVSDKRYAPTDKTLTIYADNGCKYKFYKGYFDGEAQFEEFMALFKDN